MNPYSPKIIFLLLLILLLVVVIIFFSCLRSSPKWWFNFEENARRIAENMNICSRFEVFPTIPANHSEFENQKVAIVNVSIGNRKFSSITRKSLSSWAKRYDYSFKFFDKTIDSFYHPMWQKVLAIDKVMKEGNGKKYDIVAWFDDDMYITNSKYSLSNFLSPNFSIFLSRDAENSPNHYINGGAFILRNNEIGKRFLSKILEGYFWFNGHFSSNNFHEQSIMTYLYYNEFFSSTVLPEQGTLQSIWNGNHRKWKVGDFILHSAGYPGQKRLKLFEEIDKATVVTEDGHTLTLDSWEKQISHKFSSK
jgi:hypothetical protein